VHAFERCALIVSADVFVSSATDKPIVNGDADVNVAKENDHVENGSTLMIAVFAF
jgi:hypothetical protein